MLRILSQFSDGVRSDWTGPFFSDLNTKVKEKEFMELNKKTVDDINVKGKRVLCRCDFNVPIIERKDYR
jgi:hypothetical protein